MRIPKRVNTAWDWAERHSRALGTVVVLVVAAGAALVLPALAALVIGMVAGALVVRARMQARIRKLRGDIDELLRENGALRHEKTVLESGVIAVERQPTATLMIIPEEPSEDEEPSDDRDVAGDQDTKRLKPILDDPEEFSA